MEKEKLEFEKIVREHKDTIHLYGVLYVLEGQR